MSVERSPLQMTYVVPGLGLIKWTFENQGLELVISQARVDVIAIGQMGVDALHYMRGIHETEGYGVQESRFRRPGVWTV